MASIREVARVAGVSIATVSRVINGAESVTPQVRRSVLAAIESCGYAPAVGKRSPDSLAWMYAGLFTVGSPYDSSCLEGAVDTARRHGLDLTIVDVHRDKRETESFRQFFARKGIRAAIVRCTADQRAMVASMASEEIPVVVLGDHFRQSGLEFMYADSQRASREAVEHLVAMGHQRIAYAACERDDGDHLDRFEAYRSVLSDAGLFDERLVSRVPPYRMDGAQLLRNWMAMQARPTAVFIADPLVAFGAINEAHRTGVELPDDLSIVGVDDCDLRDICYPRMTAVCQDAVQLGRSAADLAIALADGRSRKDAITSEPRAWFEVGNTSGPPPKQTVRVLPTGARVPV
ncbi:MAG: LacI family DNA-binding transcriptional regulator [Pirellulaceae bacterium]